MKSKRNATATNTTIGVLVIVVIAVAGVVFVSTRASSSSEGSTGLTSGPSVTTIISTMGSASTGSSNSVTTSETTAQCDNGSLPTNSSSSSQRQVLSREVFNVTEEFSSWNWGSLSNFTVGSYEVDLVGSQNTNTSIYLEPEVLINVTNSQGQTQPTDMTNLGNFNGDTWPPDVSGGPNVLFGGNVTIQWLFPCNGQTVFLVVTAQ
jgi:hypothetical protein